MKTIPFFHEHSETYKAFRRDIHAHPETAFEEFRTAKLIAEKLKSFGLDVVTGIGETGVVATYKNGEGAAIGLRADMDALDIEEMNDFAHKSKNRGKMHGCGHDGHSTMLLAAAHYISLHRPVKGTVHFIFQPAEENEGGARTMIEDGLFDRFPMQAVFGMHNMPGLPVGKFAVRPGPFMAAFETFDITINGIGGHGAMPHLAKDPIVAAAQLVTALQSIVSRNVDPMKQAVLSVTQINGGSAYNVIPDSVTIAGSLRYFDASYHDLLRTRIEEICKGIALSYQVEVNVTCKKGYPPLVNDSEQTAYAVQAMEKVAGTDNVISDADAILGSEDFAFMLEKKAGCYMLVGNGTGSKGGCMIHNAHYDFNDDVTPVGATYWVRLCETLMNEY